MPDGMRMMVPTDLAVLEGSPLFSAEAKRAYAAEAERAEELKQAAPIEDESIARFVERHFGEEVLRKVAAPLLSGVFGGDVSKLSMQAVMPAFVAMEREHGSLIVALQRAGSRGDEAKQAVFTSLVGGMGMLIARMKAEIPPDWIRLNTAATALKRDGERWLVNGEAFEAAIVALPAHVARGLLEPISAHMAELLTMEASSAVLVALAFEQAFELPRGFGFLVPEGEESRLLAGTFVDQKFCGRAEKGRLLRAFFCGEEALTVAEKSDDEIAEIALDELRKILGSLPQPNFSVVRRWPKSMPQYHAGHFLRVRELEKLVRAQPSLWLIGNAYRGVGIPDVIRDARTAARELLEGDTPPSP
jgi:oxygen-dependent protoporphyrinogen oxidase